MTMWSSPKARPNKQQDRWCAYVSIEILEILHFKTHALYAGEVAPFNSGCNYETFDLFPHIFNSTRVHAMQRVDQEHAVSACRKLFPAGHQARAIAARLKLLQYCHSPAT